ncbi:MAG: 3-dehydroquinate synthase [Prolixibacteraceae bacterium]|jgi:3-dehydroquinate synthase|nr:3-dehydroquinate synthase [Prolixibacteraceae bacterium]MDI9563909.1 3-dehydroquinate synthase [Bacteroidota bacterium]NLS98433.1 3-dehydroquinate synthase [Bacteroidales bacterium]OQB82254.1 MAG: 3-dehydroquinate synthase [Bacteroidetes bacterium ADurb.Bin123]HNZ69481.1 3-dehydroquinate synthase [Prolixibacteraceae bacterium]
MDNSKDRAEIIFSSSVEEDFAKVIADFPGDQIFLATDSVVEELWVCNNTLFGRFPRIVIPAGEENKNLSSAAMIWEFLTARGAGRKSLLINVGGGMLTDLAGFAASTFKRGIGFVNIPTTLLSQVDASVGGKTGINFRGLKNEIGTFREPLAVLIHTPFLKTLDRMNLLSGFAEMIKHGLIFSPAHLTELHRFDPDVADYDELREFIRHSVEVKNHFVTRDPLEADIRKALNFGHTAGHAIESLALETGHPVLHGYAVAWGMVAELFLSSETCGFPAGEARRMGNWIRQLYGPVPMNHDHSEKLLALMMHDKKNEAGLINFTLLSATGKFEINRHCSRDQVLASLESLYDL